MGLTTRTLSTLRQYWGERLGVTPDAFMEVGVTVGLSDEDGVSLFCCDDALVIGAPNSLVSEFEQRSDTLTKLDTNNKDEVQEWFNNFNTIEKCLEQRSGGTLTDRHSTQHRSSGRLNVQ
nr:hypothetical protein [Halovivax sp. KZCA124]